MAGRERWGRGDSVARPTRGESQEDSCSALCVVYTQRLWLMLLPLLHACLKNGPLACVSPPCPARGARVASSPGEACRQLEERWFDAPTAQGEVCSGCKVNFLFILWPPSGQEWRQLEERWVDASTAQREVYLHEFRVLFFCGILWLRFCVDRGWAWLQHEEI